jgi:hypothetical protein
VLAAVFGALRAKTVRLWLQDGQAWSKGNWLTASLWIVAFAAHLGYDGRLAHAHGASGVGPAPPWFSTWPSDWAFSASSCCSERTICSPFTPPRSSSLAAQPGRNDAHKTGNSVNQ